jgi:hypothetical protein
MSGDTAEERRKDYAHGKRVNGEELGQARRHIRHPGTKGEDGTDRGTQGLRVRTGERKGAGEGKQLSRRTSFDIAQDRCSPRLGCARQRAGWKFYGR